MSSYLKVVWCWCLMIERPWGKRGVGRAGWGQFITTPSRKKLFSLFISTFLFLFYHSCGKFIYLIQVIECSSVLVFIFNLTKRKSILLSSLADLAKRFFFF